MQKLSLFLSQHPLQIFVYVLITAIVLLLLSNYSYAGKVKESTMQPKPEKTETIVLGMGCFWGAEKRMAALAGVVDVESGYAGGDLANATYEQLHQTEQQIADGAKTTNHAEVVKVVFDPSKVSLAEVLAQFWQSHNPTQGNRQGNDVGSTYRSAIYTTSDSQLATAIHTRKVYQANLHAGGVKADITTEIKALKNYSSAEDYHQNYLKKNPLGYCGLGGTGVRYEDKNSAQKTKVAVAASAATTSHALNMSAPDGVPAHLWANQWSDAVVAELSSGMQIIAFESEGCGYCAQFNKEVLRKWQSPTPIMATHLPTPPKGWELKEALFATPTIVLFNGKKEVARYMGYQGEAKFWKWLGFAVLSKEQQQIAFESGTERPFSGDLSHKGKGTYVDPITGAALFRSDTKFDSGTGWPSFFNPLPGALTYHKDDAHGMERTEVRSSSSGIHLGHVFNDGPPPSGKRYCINSKVLTFIADKN